MVQQLAPGYFEVRHVARELGVSTRTLIRWEKAGLIPVPPRRHGRRVYTAEAIEAIRSMVIEDATPADDARSN